MRAKSKLLALLLALVMVLGTALPAFAADEDVSVDTAEAVETAESAEPGESSGSDEAGEASEPVKSTDIVVLYTNDVHTYIDQKGLT